jgi:hypothetical protein
VEELQDFYERYIAAFNARDAEAYAACFHAPVTMMRADRGGDRPDDAPFTIVEDPGAFPARMPAHWSHSTVDSVSTLGDALPFAIADGLPEPRGRRLGVMAVASRWDHDGQRYEQVQALYLLSRREGKLGIKFIAELGFTRRRSER